MTDPPVGLHPWAVPVPAGRERHVAPAGVGLHHSLEMDPLRPRPLLWRRRGVRLLPRLQSRPAGSDRGVAV